MKNTLKIICIILSLCLLCSCSKVALDSAKPDADTEQDNTESTVPEDTGADSSETESSDPGGQAETPPSVIAFRTFTTYEDIFSVINGNSDISYGVYPEEAQQADGSATVVSANGLTEQEHLLSVTASDGKLIYTLYRGTLFICDETGIISETFLFTDDYSVGSGEDFSYDSETAEGVFLTGNKLTVVTSLYSYSMSDGETHRINIYFCDVSDPAAPNNVNTLSQDGRFVSAAAHDGHIYAVSSLLIGSAEESDITTYIPHTYDPGTVVPGSSGSSATPIAPEKISVFEYSTGAGYTIVAGYNTENGTLADSAAVLGGTGRLYMDDTDIYMVFFSETSEITSSYTEGSYDVEEYSDHCMSAVIKFPMTADVSPSGEALVDGCFIGDFSIYSKDGKLYLCTISEHSDYAVYSDSESGWSERRDISAEVENVLYELSDDLVNVNSTILPNQEISSARFAEGFMWVDYYSENQCFDISTGEPVSIAAVPECLRRYSEEFWLGISRTDSDTLNFTMYNAADFSEAVSTDLVISTAYLNSASVQLHPESGLITLSAGSNKHFVVSFNGEGFSLEAETAVSGWAHSIATDSALFVISDNVTALSTEDYSWIGVFDLPVQLGAVG